MMLDLTNATAEANRDRVAIGVVREPVSHDAEGLAQLMLDAYRGTTDDGGETIEDARAEVAKLFAGQYGLLDASASNLVEADGHVVAATIITRDATKVAPGEAFLAFSMTASTWKRRGLARAGLAHAINVLRSRGEPRLHLLVTRENAPAAKLYRDVGFVTTQSR